MQEHILFLLCPPGALEKSKAIESEMGFTTMGHGLDCSNLYNVFIANNLLDVKYNTTGLDKQKFSAKNCKYFLTHNFSICFGC